MELTGRLITSSDEAVTDWTSANPNGEKFLLSGDDAKIDVSGFYFFSRVYADLESDGTVRVVGYVTRDADGDELANTSVLAADGESQVAARSVEAYSYIEVYANSNATVQLCAE